MKNASFFVLIGLGSAWFVACGNNDSRSHGEDGGNASFAGTSQTETTQGGSSGEGGQVSRTSTNGSANGGTHSNTSSENAGGSVSYGGFDGTAGVTGVIGGSLGAGGVTEIGGAIGTGDIPGFGGSTGVSTGGTSTSSSTAGGATTHSYGFVLQPPSSNTVTCEDIGDTSFDDADWICAFDYGGAHGYVYLLAEATACKISPTLTVRVAQLSLNGVVTTLKGATYDWGGNHHNDSISFLHNGNRFTFFHSSFGYGSRSCQNMDCLNVDMGATGKTTDVGCGTDRKNPIVCSKVKSDGAFDDLSIDPFERCPGDPYGS
jgi:hypothetical protein